MDKELLIFGKALLIEIVVSQLIVFPHDLKRIAELAQEIKELAEQ